MSDSRMPLISIITPCLNAVATLREAVESVGSPIPDEVEHLLIDACSSDGTLAEAAKFPHIRVISEPDRGIYDGMNKGARLARGKWLLFLQSDDWLPPGTLQTYLSTIASQPHAQMICGSAEAVKRDGNVWATVWSVSGREARELTVANIALGEPMINARLIRRDVFMNLGGFSLDYTLASDREFLIRATFLKPLSVAIPEMTYRYRWHEHSSTMTEFNSLSGRLARENLTIAGKYLKITAGKDLQAFRRWHTRITVQMAMNALERRDISRLLEAASKGAEGNCVWPFALVCEILKSLPGFLMRGGKTRTQIAAETIKR